MGVQLIDHFLKSGFLVVTTTRDRSKFLQQKQALLHPDYQSALKIIEVDFLESGAAEKIAGFLETEKIKIQHIVHNARSLKFLQIGSDNSVTAEDFAGEYYVNVIFPYRLTISMLQQSNNLKNIVFISSIYGVVGPTPALYDDFHQSSPIHYGVSKAAQIHLTKELAVRLSPNIRVNCISFGGIEGRTDEAFNKRYSSLNPLARMLKEADVIGPVDFLISENSASMTGQNIIVDGGWTTW